jgi:hypothetical protein
MKKAAQFMPAQIDPHRAFPSASAHIDALLDEALEETFPASDAVAIDIEGGLAEGRRQSHSTTSLERRESAP